MLYHCFSFCLVPDPLIPVGPAVRTFIPESSVVSRLLCVGHVVAVVAIVVLVATATAAAAAAAEAVAAVAVLVEVEVVVALVVKTWRAYALSIVFFRSGNRFSAPGILELQVCFVFFGFILASLLFCAASSSSFSSFVLVSMVAALLFSCSNIHSNNKNPTTKMAGETHLKNSKQKAESSNSDGDEDNDDDDR